MIDLLKLTPYIYGKRSRDYQILARIYNAAFNEPKMNIDSMQHLRDINMPDSVAELAAKTVGFEARHHYDTSILKAISVNFNYLVRKKGTKGAIEDAVKLLLRSQNFDSAVNVKITRVPEAGSTDTEYEVKIFVEYPDTDTANIIALDDLLNYLLPVGFVYTIYNNGTDEKNKSTDIVFNSSEYGDVYSSSSLATVSGFNNNLGSAVQGFNNSNIVSNNNKNHDPTLIVSGQVNTVVANKKEA